MSNPKDTKDTKDKTKKNQKMEDRNINPMTMIPDSFKVSKQSAPTAKEKAMKKLYGF